MRLVTIFLLALTLAVPAVAGELGGVELPDSRQISGQTLTLNGMALRKKLMFKVYVAGLYLPQKTSDAPAVLAKDAPRHLDMVFVRNVSKDQICDAWYEGLEANTPNASAELRKQFDTLCSFMADVGDGDAYGFTYVPGTGTTVTVQGQKKGTIEGKAFADALFASWIGPHPGPGEDFRDDLMGG